MAVQVIFQDIQGKEIGRFMGNDTMSLYQMAKQQGIDIPVSCCAGACFVCCAKIIQGAEMIQIDKLSVPLVDVEYDATSKLPTQVLTCIGGIQSCYIHDNHMHTIVLQKLL